MQETQVAKKEMQMSTELLAEVGVEEPSMLKMMKTKSFLVFYLIFNLVSASAELSQTKLFR